jgi:hypothetical protein
VLRMCCILKFEKTNTHQIDVLPIRECHDLDRIHMPSWLLFKTELRFEANRVLGPSSNVQKHIENVRNHFTLSRIILISCISRVSELLRWLESVPVPIQWNVISTYG